MQRQSRVCLGNKATDLPQLPTLNTTSPTATEPRGGVRPPFADYGSSPPKDAPRVASWAAPYLFSFWGYGRPVIIIPQPPPVRWLSLTTLDANELDQDGKYTVLSAITAECQPPIHLPLVIDYLLVAAFEVFGSLSDETIHLDLRPDDPRVIQLR